MAQIEQTQWYYSSNGQRVGPVGLEQLQGNARTGVLKPTDFVWRNGMAQWVAAGSVGEIFAGIAVPPPLPQTVGYAAPPPPGQGPDIGQDAGMRMLLPVGRSGWAIAAGYLGLFAVIPIFAPFALVCGILAIRDIRRDPNKHGMGRAVFGLIMGILFTLLLLVFVFVIAMGK